MNATPALSTCCTVDGCQNPPRTRGLCDGHYKRFRVYGNAEAGRPVPPQTPKAACSIADCGSSVLARGWCNRHYSAWKKHGDPLHYDRPKVVPPCSVATCDRDVVNAGLCAGHYTRLRTHGDVRADEPLRPYSRGRTGTCQADGCDKTPHAKGLCSTHYSQQYTEKIAQATCAIPGCDRPRRVLGQGLCEAHYKRSLEYGDPLAGPPTRQQRSPNHAPSVATAEYRANHRQVRRARGPAWQCICAHCGNAAQDWATIHGRSGADPADFMPLCKSCHGKYDGHAWPVRLGEDHGNAKLTDDAVRDIRISYSAGVSFAALGRKYKVTAQTVRYAATRQTWKHVA